MSILPDYTFDETRHRIPLTVGDAVADTETTTWTQLLGTSSEPPKKRATGIDISKYQGSFKPQAHHDFVIIRATMGIGQDALFEQHLEEAGDLYVGAYHYIYSSVDWRTQADNLLQTADGKVDFYALDYEKSYNQPSKYFAEDAKHFVEFVHDDTCLPVLFYSNPSTIQEWMFQYGVYWVRDYADLWIAQWPYNGWNDVLGTIPMDWDWNPRLPAGCTKWRVWQYSADGNRQGANNGVDSYDVDLDVFNGTVDDMAAWLGGVAPEPVTDRNDIIDECIDASIDALERLKE